MSYLRHDEFVPFAPNESGRSVRINHDSDYCSGDSDSMQITRGDDNVVRAYCHRCGLSGSYREDFFRTPSRKATVSSTGSSTYTFSGIPRDATGDVRAWHPSARVWVSKARITPDEVKRYGIVYSPYNGRIILPVYNGSDLVGYQARKILGEGPKYYTKTADTDSMFWISDHPHNNDTLVLCEDILSAIRCRRFMSAGAVLGVYLSDKSIDRVIKGCYNTILIYLDNDNPKVITQRNVLKKTLELFTPKVKIIKETTDPKNLSDMELREVLGL